MLGKSNSCSNSTISSSKLTTQLNLTKCTTSNANSLEVAGNLAVDGRLKFWPPSQAVVDALVLKLKAKDGDMEANWEKIILNFKKELDEEEQLKHPSSSGVDNNGGSGEGIEGTEKARAKFSVPLSRREMEKDFEDMGERRLPRKPKKRPKIVQNQLDTLFPGLWLTEIHADLYRVSETKKLIGANTADSASHSIETHSFGSFANRYGCLADYVEHKRRTMSVTMISVVVVIFLIILGCHIRSL